MYTMRILPRLATAVALAVATSTVVCSSARADLGTAGAYHPPYTPTTCYGNRQDVFPPGSRFATVNSALWDNSAACGRQYVVRCLSGGGASPCIAGARIQVKVVGYCSTPGTCKTFMLPDAAWNVLVRPGRGGQGLNIEFTQV